LTERISRSLFIQQSNLSDYNVVQRNRMVVGLPPTNTVQKCKCGKLLDSRHALSCVETRKVCLEPRHDMVRDAIKGALDRYNISSIIEYRPLSHDLSSGKLNRIRPDGCTHAMNDLWDVCVTTPTCQSYIERNSDTKGLVAAKINENAKTAKYEKVAVQEGYKFTPLVFESF